MNAKCSETKKIVAEFVIAYVNNSNKPLIRT